MAWSRLGDVLPKQFLKGRVDRELRLARTFADWERVVGVDLAGLAAPLKHKGTLLVLWAPDPTALQEARYFTYDYLERVNAALGEIFFDKLRVELLKVQTPPRWDQAAVVRPYIRPTGPRDLGSLRGMGLGDGPLAHAYRAYARFFGKLPPDAGEP